MLDGQLNRQPSRRDVTISPDERLRIGEEQSIETSWWSDAPKMQTVTDIESAIESGAAVRVPEEGEGYRLSPGVREEFRALDRRAFELMESIAIAWNQAIHAKYQDLEPVYLRITSLARTVEYQEELALRGYPAAADSTHTRLGAFDILSSFLEKNHPYLLRDLDSILTELQAAGRINWIREPEVGAYHIALNPNIH